MLSAVKSVFEIAAAGKITISTKEFAAHTYPSREDSRIRLSELTTYGKELISMINHTRQRIMREALEDWTPEEKTNLLNHLRRLSDSLNKFD